MLWSMLVFLGSTEAAACGGFFCDNAQPVDQAGERILFFTDAASGELEMHVQVTYAGPSEEFSWLLPVPTEPEVFLGVEDAFSRIAAATNPTFLPTVEAIGDCSPGIRSLEMAMSDSAGPPEDGGVTVQAEEQVGPYDTQLLTATDAATLVTWLTENGYDLPEGAEEKLGLYVQEGAWFVGLKLRKDRGDGDLAPIGLRFSGASPMIPLQLTAVAATPDMPLQPFLLGDVRAVPENYLHVQINPLAVDWLSGAANYPSVIGRAADEAGGQAFATDFAGPTASLAVNLHEQGQYPLDEMELADDATDVAQLLMSLGYIFPGDTSWQRERYFPVSTGTIPILRRFIDKPARYRETDDSTFYGCLDCFVNPGEIAVDGAGLAAALDMEWVQPMQRVQGLLDASPYLTRLTSSISADEMSVDPRFHFNPDLGDVAAAREATLEVYCRGLHDFGNAPRALVLPDGRRLELPSAVEWSEMTEQGLTWDDYLGEVGEHAAEIVEQVGRSGQPTMVTDNRGAIDEALAAHNKGCGCDGTGGAGGVAAALAGLLVARRRRSAR